MQILEGLLLLYSVFLPQYMKYFATMLYRPLLCSQFAKGFTSTDPVIYYTHY